MFDSLPTLESYQVFLAVSGVLFFLASIALNWLLLGPQPLVRVLLGTFLLFIFGTITVGNLLIVCTEGRVLDSLTGSGLDVSRLHQIDLFQIWVLTVLPFGTLTGLTLALRPFVLELVSARQPKKSPANEFSTASIAAVAIALCGFSIFPIITSDVFWNTVRSFSSLDYQNQILARHSILANLNVLHASMIYFGQPLLLCLSVHKFIKVKSWRNAAVCLILLALTFGSQLLTFQKSQAAITILLLFVTLAYSRALPMKLLPLPAALLVALLTVYQSRFVGSWSIFSTLKLMVFRTASVLPFYQSIYPQELPLQGVTGPWFNNPENDHFMVFNRMYPTVNWTQGSAPGPDYLRAFSKAGYWGSLNSLVITWLAATLFAIWISRQSGERRLMSFLTGVIFMYCLTQTSLQDALISSYGVVWLIGLNLLMSKVNQLSLPSRAGET